MNKANSRACELSLVPNTFSGQCARNSFIFSRKRPIFLRKSCRFLRSRHTLFIRSSSWLLLWNSSISMEEACYFFYGSRIGRFPRNDPSLLCGTVPFLQSIFLEIATFFIKKLCPLWATVLLFSARTAGAVLQLLDNLHILHICVRNNNGLAFLHVF